MKKKDIIYTKKKTDNKNMCRLKLTDSVVANNYFLLLCFVIWLLSPDVFTVCLKQNKIIGSGRVFLGQEEYNGSSTH
jgi:hypothetical protein